MKKAIYAGTFDPITFGHIDVVTRAIKVFDKVYIGVSAEPKHTLFSQKERIDLIKHILPDPRIEVRGFSSLLVDFAKKLGASTIVRGIRAVSDFDYELQQTLMNRKLAPKIETIFLMPSEKNIFISSSLVKEIASLGGDVSHLVPDVVVKALKRKLKAR